MSQQAALLHAGSEPGDTSHPETASKSPTTSVGAAHGIGSSPIAGPLKAQAQPLQTNPLKLMEENGDPEIPGRTADPPSARDLRASPSSASTVTLSPSQQAFVDQVKKKYQRGTSTPHEDSPPVPAIPRVREQPSPRNNQLQPRFRDVRRQGAEQR